MATYAVGDVQGCLAPLEQLLERVQFDPDRDRLWVAGDLINRGPDSLGALRLVKNLGASATMVLGNHDLHLLGVVHGARKQNKKDTLSPILRAVDRGELLDWLRRQPLLHHDPALGYVMTHAGIPPVWSLAQAQARAAEVEAVLRADDYSEFFAHMYGNDPEGWRDDLTGWDRLRVIVNYFTRMRFCSPSGRLNLKAKEGPESAPPGFAPWFSYPNQLGDQKVLFGHWAALEGKTHNPQIIALDTGCVWGNALTMMRLEDEERFEISCQLQASSGK